MKKYFWIVIVAIVAMAGVEVWLAKQKHAQTKDAEIELSNVVEITAQAQKNIGLTIVDARMEGVADELTATGIVAPDESRMARIAPVSPGVIADVRVQLGDRVRKGQALLVYDNIELGETLGDYQNLTAMLGKAQAQSNVAKKMYDNAQALIRAEAISQKELDLRRAEYEQAQAEVASRRAELARAEERLHRNGMSDAAIERMQGAAAHRTASHSVLSSPIAGVVARYNVTRGQVVGREQELMTIVDTSSVWVQADIYEKDISRVPSGGACLITLSAYPSEVFRGRIDYLSDALDPASRTAKLRCVVPNVDGRIKLDMFASVKILSASRRQALIAPASAAQQIDGRDVVFVQASATRFEKRFVELGEKREDSVEIKSGLRAGEKVVAIGSFQVKSAFMSSTIGGDE